MAHTVLVVIAVIVIVAYVLGRQLVGEPLRGKRVVLLPAILAVIGAVDLGKDGRHLQPLDIAFIVASGLVATGIGFGQGAMMRLENRNGGLWGQLPARSLWLWGLLVAGRIVLGLAAGAAGAHVAASTAPILLVLGVNRLAQAASIVLRAVRAGIPFAAEKDGTTFLGGLGHGVTDSAGPERTPIAPDALRTTSGRQVIAGLGAELQDRHAQRREDRDRTGRRSSRGRRR